MNVLMTQEASARTRPRAPERRRKLVRAVVLLACLVPVLILVARFFSGGVPRDAAQVRSLVIEIAPDRVVGVDVEDRRLRITVGTASRAATRDAPEMKVSLEGLKRLVDALGGVLVNVPETIEYKGADGLPVRIDAGMRRLDADRVAAYFNVPGGSRPAALRALVLGVALRGSELLTARVDLTRLIDAALEPSARGEDGANATRLASLLVHAGNLGPADISVEWMEPDNAASPASGPAAASAAPAAVTPSVTLPIRVRILNGVGQPGLAARAASHLPGPRYVIVETRNADRFGYRRTLVRSKQPALVREIGSVLGVGQEEAREAGAGADVDVILGADARNRW